jgi:hypothetical protein
MTTSHQKEQAERASLVGSTTGMTYHSRAITGLDLERSGRHAQHATVVGSKPAVAYPRMPEGSPWHSDLVPPEGPTGYAIDAQEPVGEVFEVEASLREAASVLAFPSDADASAGVDDHSDPGDPAPTSGMSHREVGALSPNVIADPPSDNPTNAEVGGEAGRGDVGPGVHGDACTGTTSPLLRRGRKL